MAKSPFLWRTILLVFVLGPLIATAYAMYSLWQNWIGWTEFTLFLVLYFATGVGITFGYHRDQGLPEPFSLRRSASSAARRSDMSRRLLMMPLMLTCAMLVSP